MLQAPERCARGVMRHDPQRAGRAHGLKQRFRHNGVVLDVKRLQVLLAIVEEGSVTGAATALGYTPSAVSQRLLRLEREAGQPLLDRHAAACAPPTPPSSWRPPARSYASSPLRSPTWPTSPAYDAAASPSAVPDRREFLPPAGRTPLPRALSGHQLTIHSGREDHLVQMLEEGRVALSPAVGLRVAAGRQRGAGSDRAVHRSHRAAGRRHPPARAAPTVR